jgi:hypothetical protein
MATQIVHPEAPPAPKYDTLKLGSTLDTDTKDKDEVLESEYTCSRPIRIIGVQEETPLCWSDDGKR